ncbi:hypothetical protein [Thermoleptolyngbya sp. M55_K2018_002]|uniref:hypothetical protein n=1 Tax=Thermoleptolyngbya sp. M55_K2018_002 TaxID=2747808 RepID=UPI0019E51CD4|nr:hypothetical protein [Thermoleptolyngbya sp. M55_K2018_002]HIK39364.1 hypothetical protein [Thermoleptolyngbya sp. M55_K2018_002]
MQDVLAPASSLFHQQNAETRTDSQPNPRNSSMVHAVGDRQIQDSRLLGDFDLSAAG